MSFYEMSFYEMSVYEMSFYEMSCPRNVLSMKCLSICHSGKCPNTKNKMVIIIVLKL